MFKGLYYRQIFKIFDLKKNTYINIIFPGHFKTNFMTVQIHREKLIS